MTKIQQGLPRTLNSHFPSYNSYMHENPFCLADVILSDSIFHFAKKKKKKKCHGCKINVTGSLG